LFDVVLLVVKLATNRTWLDATTINLNLHWQKSVVFLIIKLHRQLLIQCCFMCSIAAVVKTCQN